MEPSEIKRILYKKNIVSFQIEIQITFQHNIKWYVLKIVFVALSMFADSIQNLPSLQVMITEIVNTEIYNFNYNYTYD